MRILTTLCFSKIAWFTGPSGANMFTPRKWGNVSDEVTNDITLEVTRVVLALGVFAIGVGEQALMPALCSWPDESHEELPGAYMLRHCLTVVPVMAWGWFVSAGENVGDPCLYDLMVSCARPHCCPVPRAHISVCPGNFRLSNADGPYPRCCSCRGTLRR